LNSSFVAYLVDSSKRLNDEKAALHEFEDCKAVSAVARIVGGG